MYSERNQRALLKLLFDAAAGTLLKFGRGELGGKIGFTLVLHTWDQQLRPHFHVHALDIPPQLAELAGIDSRHHCLHRWRNKPWVVYSKPPFAGPRKLVDYLGRYTHRVAISNNRLLSCEDGQVHFTYRDRRDRDRRKIATLPAEEFIRRFLGHVLPDRFLRIRHYGLLANRDKKKRLAHCRTLLGVKVPKSPREKPHTAADWMQTLLGLDVNRCPCCGDVLNREFLQPAPVSTDAPGPHPTRHFQAWDTS